MRARDRACIVLAHGAGRGDKDGMDVTITCENAPDLAGLGEEWRALASEARPRSFFQGWTWIGCLVEERFPDAVVLRAQRGARVVGMALFNRRGKRLHLTESGDNDLDAPFVEQNAPLVSADAPPGCAAALLAAASRLEGVGGLVLSGVDTGLAALPGMVSARCQVRPAPYVDLARLRREGQPFDDMLSPGTRYQIRRSHRRYERDGTVTLSRAATAEEALAWFAQMVALHETSWNERGKPGAFRGEFMMRFQRSLLVRASATGELDMLRLTAGSGVVGFLLNFRSNGWIHAYQSGLHRSGAGPHGKPGLTCHALAIQQGIATGAVAYDFLGGDARYKRSLSNASRDLHWVELVPRWSVAGLRAAGLQVARWAKARGEARHSG